MLELWMAVLPMGLWFLEQFLPYPAIVEETAKAFIVYRSGSGRQAVILGLIFGVSEAFLYLFNANQIVGLGAWWWRLILTVPMHGLTAAVMVKFGKPGFILAVVIHYLFNLKIAN